MPYELDDDRDRIDVDVAVGYLTTEAYWGRWRRREHIVRQFREAWRVVGAYEVATGAMVGAARAVSDDVAIAYLADVFVLAPHRGRGLGISLVRAMIEEGAGASFRWLLHTADAHGMYGHFGFAPADHTVMERPGRNGPPPEAHQQGG